MDIKNDFATGLKAHWTMDETSGTREDSVGSNDLTDNNTVGYGTGKQSNAADFELSNSEYFTVADHADLRVDDGWSVSMWVNAETLTDGYFLNVRSGENGWGLGLATAGNIRVYAGSGSFGDQTSSGTLSTGTWYHVAVYYSGTSTKLYINGALDSTLSLNAIINPNTTLNVGKKATASAVFHDGLMDEITFWNRELTATDVANIYNSGDGIPYEAASTNEVKSIAGVSNIS